ncbi:MAG TPA: hypothetical protein VMC43_02390, partial [Candidatus Paceibacterota bacterium]|nr:hypothetical protein [Candidatus Paceibacterota bacterium]
AGGWHYYFPFVYLVKEPLPTIILVLTALLVSLWGIGRILVRQRWAARWRFAEYLGTHFTEFALISFVVLYWAYSIQSPLNIGFRHLFPTLPFIYILTIGFWKRWLTDLQLPPTDNSWQLLWRGLRAIVTSSVEYTALVILLVWFAAETVLSAPYFLSYFNELGGGPWNGYKLVTDSNYDWGQDLIRLQAFVAAHPEIDKIGVDYFGGGEPKYYLGDKEENWWSSRGSPRNTDIKWFAISINTLQGAIQKPAPGFQRNSWDEYSWLTQARPPKTGLGEVPTPDYRIGTSIFVYKL